MHGAHLFHVLLHFLFSGVAKDCGHESAIPDNVQYLENYLMQSGKPLAKWLDFAFVLLYHRVLTLPPSSTGRDGR